MRDVAAKSNGTDQLEDAEWNEVFLDLKEALTSRGMTLTDANLNQMSTAFLEGATLGDFYEDNGSIVGTLDVVTPSLGTLIDAFGLLPGALVRMFAPVVMGQTPTPFLEVDGSASMIVEVDNNNGSLAVDFVPAGAALELQVQSNGTQFSFVPKEQIGFMESGRLNLLSGASNQTVEFDSMFHAGAPRVFTQVSESGHTGDIEVDAVTDTDFTITNNTGANVAVDWIALGDSVWST